MLKRRIAALLLLLSLLLSSAAADSAPPYAIKVNRVMNTVTIYTRDATGSYSVPVKAMICSTAREGHNTPLGSYNLVQWRSEWRLMLDGTYGQYATCFYGNYLFHSVCYTDDEHNAMKQDAYNALGSAASMGCIRLQTEDAKWIYDNCHAGTPVVIYDDPTSPGPLGKPEKLVDHIPDSLHNGWDPTDPTEGNPWRRLLPETVTMEAPALTMTAGDSRELKVTSVPENVPLTWTSTNGAVARVDDKGRVTALSAGTAEIRASGLNGVETACTVTVEGELLPFDDITPGAWYYSELRQALKDDLFHGTGERKFAPDDGMTRAMVVQVLYNLAGQAEEEVLPEEPEFIPEEEAEEPEFIPEEEAEEPEFIPEESAEGPEEDLTVAAPPEESTPEASQKRFEDVAEDAWYYDAVTWATRVGVVNGVSETSFAPMRNITRQELLTLLWRLAGQPKQDETVQSADAASVEPYAAEACRWALANELIWTGTGALQPWSISPRAETALIFSRALHGGWLTADKV